MAARSCVRVRGAARVHGGRHQAVASRRGKKGSLEEPPGASRTPGERRRPAVGWGLGPGGLGTKACLGLAPLPGVRPLKNAPGAQDAMDKPLQDAPRHAVAQEGEAGGVPGPPARPVLEALSSGVLGHTGRPAPRSKPVAHGVAVEEARHNGAGGSLGSPPTAEPLGASPVASQSLLAGSQPDQLNVGPGAFGSRKGLRVVLGRARGQNGREVHPQLRGQRLRHAKVSRSPGAIPSEANHPQPRPVLGNPVLDGVEDAPLDVVIHSLQLSHTSLPPLPASVRGHPVALLHEEGKGPVEPNGPENLIQERGPVVRLPQLLAAPCPGLAGGAGHIKVQVGARYVLGPHVAVDALRPVVGLAEVPGTIPDVRGPGLGNGEVANEDGVKGEGRHVHAAEVGGEG